MGYLDRSGLIVPMRLGKSKKAPLSYDWKQVIQLTVYENVNRRMPSQILKEVLDEIDNNCHLPEFFRLNYFIYNNTLQRYNNNVSLPEIIKVIEDNYKRNHFPQYLYQTIVTLPPVPKTESKSDKVKLNSKSVLSDTPANASLVWHPSFSMGYIVKQVYDRAKKSDIVDYEDFKKMSDYDSIKNIVHLD
jgi:hypothetical protein